GVGLPASLSPRDLMFPSIRSRPVHACALAVASLALAGCAHHSATPEPGPAPAGGGPAISADDLRQRLFILANDSMLGRETGTAGNVKATNYIAAEAAKLGLRPAGENGTFFQTVPLI